MKGKKQKGFTLVEVIAALAILTAGVTVVYSVFTFASATWVKEKNNLELVSNNQSVAQSLKALGKTNIKNIVSTKGDGSDNADVYIYFNNYDDLSLELSDFIKTSTSTDYYSDCQSKNILHHKFGVHLKISKHNFLDTEYTQYYYYEIDETVWNLNLTTEANSQSDFYIGR